MAARAADRALSARSGWSMPSNEVCRAQNGEVGDAAAEELSRWLAQALVEERQALRSALERSHWESRAALDEELGRRHGVLTAQLRQRCQAQQERGGPDCFPGVPSQGKADGWASHTTTTCTPHPTSQSVVVLQQFATDRGVSTADDRGKKDGPDATFTVDALEQDIRLPTHSVGTQSVQNRVNTLLFNGKARDVQHRWVDFVEGAFFETFMAILIMLNGLQMAFEVQHSGLIRGHALKYRDYAHNPNPWQGAEHLWEALGIFFGVAFTFEVSIKIVVLRCKFFKSCWNLFDLFVVLCFLVESSAVVQGGLGETTALRLARLARLLRLVRVVRKMHGFDTLFLMTTALQSSFYVLAWSCMLLFIIQAMVAFSINQILEEFYFGDHHPLEEQDEIFEYFGSFSRALLSTFEMTLANWPPVCRLLMENVSEWFMVVCLLHKLTVFGNLAGGQGGQKESSTRTHNIKMQKLFEAGDTSGDGKLDKEEFLELTQNDEVKTWLSSMGLDASDGEALYDFMDVDKTGDVSVKELIDGVSKLKGAARSLDLHMCLKRQDELHQTLRDMHPEIGQRLKDRRGLAFASDRASADCGASAAAPEPQSPCTVISDASEDGGVNPLDPHQLSLPDAPRMLTIPQPCRMTSLSD
ncbi:unnamed protein product [Prorocentrum cordatum]|uniref:EF-hand domain-containing protein n=1 Tax=Prorocentrum cordatum TaxID=2364126 RepID=A0ABN9T354_9DINO|nr:unnamed protein product [Polarella glacialis]